MARTVKSDTNSKKKAYEKLDSVFQILESPRGRKILLLIIMFGMGMTGVIYQTDKVIEYLAECEQTYLVKIAQFFFELLDKCGLANEPSMGNLVAIVVVIWTVTITLSMYWIAKMEQRVYGIRIIDVMLRDLGYSKIFRISIIIVLIIIGLIFVVITDIYILGVAITIFQVYIMIYLLLLILIKVSFTNIERVIEEELKQFLKEYVVNEARQVRNENFYNTLFFSMLTNMNFIDVEDVEKFKELLKKITVILKNRQINLIGEQLLAEQKWQITLSEEISKYIMVGAKEDYDYVAILKFWLMESNEVREIEQGIIKALIGEMTPQIQDVIMKLLQTLQNSTERRLLVIWYITVNLFYWNNDDDSYRIYYAEEMIRMIKARWSGNDIRCMLTYLKQLSTNDKKYNGLFFKKIWDWEGAF